MNFVQSVSFFGTYAPTGYLLSAKLGEICVNFRTQVVDITIPTVFQDLTPTGIFPYCVFTL